MFTVWKVTILMLLVTGMLRLAAVENKVQEEQVSEIQLALAPEAVTAFGYTKEASKKNIAGKVTDSMAKVARQHTGRVRNLGVRNTLSVLCSSPLERGCQRS